MINTFVGVGRSDDLISDDWSLRSNMLRTLNFLLFSLALGFFLLHGWFLISLVIWLHLVILGGFLPASLDSLGALNRLNGWLYRLLRNKVRGL